MYKRQATDNVIVVVPVATATTVTVFGVLVTVATDAALETEVVIGVTPPDTVKDSGPVVIPTSIDWALTDVIVGTAFTVTVNVVEVDKVPASVTVSVIVAEPV